MPVKTADLASLFQLAFAANGTIAYLASTYTQKIDELAQIVTDKILAKSSYDPKEVLEAVKHGIFYSSKAAYYFRHFVFCGIALSLLSTTISFIFLLAPAISKLESINTTFAICILIFMVFIMPIYYYIIKQLSDVMIKYIKNYTEINEK